MTLYENKLNMLKTGNQAYLPSVVEDSYNEHEHEKNGHSFSPDILRPKTMKRIDL